MTNVIPIFIPGAGRAGTTFLMDIIASHRKVCGCKHKEPCFYDGNEYLGRGFYDSLFDIKDSHEYTVEASTNYLWYPNALEKIIARNANSKFVISLRNPGARLFAEYTRRIERNGEDRSFLEVSESIERMRRRSEYSSHLTRLLEQTHPDNVLVLIFEEWSRSANDLPNQIGTFLGLDANDFEVPTKERNKSSVPISLTLQKLNKKYFPSDQGDGWLTFRYRALMRKTINKVNHIAPDMRKFPSVTPYKGYLKERYFEEVEAVEQLLGRRLDVWRDWYA